MGKEGWWVDSRDAIASKKLDEFEKFRKFPF